MGRVEEKEGRIFDSRGSEAGFAGFIGFTGLWSCLNCDLCDLLISRNLKEVTHTGNREWNSLLQKIGRRTRGGCVLLCIISGILR